jgi:predicted nucleic acid-binding protein
LIFVDTSAWYALKATDDRFHDDAVSFHDELMSGRQGSLVVTDYVLDETATLLMDRKGGNVAAGFLDEALASKSVRLIWVSPDLFHEAIRTFKNAGDRRWSFTDCTSFQLMHRLKISDAFAFDEHFGEAGFNRLPRVVLP